MDFNDILPSLFLACFCLLCCDRYVEGMRKRKLQGGKQDIAGTKQEDSRTKDWIVELNAASRALALRWLRAAREGIDGKRVLGYREVRAGATVNTCYRFRG